MTLSRRTVWIAGTAVICLLIAALSWLVLISPQRTSAADLVSQRENADSKATTLGSQIASLKEQSLQLSTKRAELAAIHTEMPATIDMSGLVASVVKIADGTGVSVTTLSPGVLSAVADSASGTAAATAATGTAAGVQQMSISIAVSGEYFETSQFLKRLQTQLPQAFLVDTLSVAGTDKETTLSVQGRVFTLPASA